MREPNNQAEGVWEAQSWILVAQEDRLYRQQYPDPGARREAARRLAKGESPRSVFGWTGHELPIHRVRSVEWVPDVDTLLVRRGWWRDPWRIAFADSDTGKQVFQTLGALLPGASPPLKARVGPNDLPMDPRLGIGVFLAFMGLVGLLGGAVEGVGQAPMLGPERRFRIFAEVGETIGLAGVLGIAAVAFVAGVLGLVWWYRHRPTKFVVRARRDLAALEEE